LPKVTLCHISPYLSFYTFNSKLFLSSIWKGKFLQKLYEVKQKENAKLYSEKENWGSINVYLLTFSPDKTKFLLKKLLFLMPFYNALKTKTMFCQQCRRASKLHYYFFPWPWNVLPNPTHHTFFSPSDFFFHEGIHSIFSYFILWKFLKIISKKRKTSKVWKYLLNPGRNQTSNKRGFSMYIFWYPGHSD